MVSLRLAYENPEGQQKNEGSPPAVLEFTTVAYTAEDRRHEKTYERTQRPHQRHTLVIDTDLQQRRRNEGGFRRV